MSAVMFMYIVLQVTVPRPPKVTIQWLLALRSHGLPVKIASGACMHNLRMYVLIVLVMIWLYAKFLVLDDKCA